MFFIFKGKKNGVGSPLKSESGNALWRSQDKEVLYWEHDQVGKENFLVKIWSLHSFANWISFLSIIFSIKNYLHILKNEWNKSYDCTSKCNKNYLRISSINGLSSTIAYVFRHWMNNRPSIWAPRGLFQISKRYITEQGYQLVSI